MFRLPEKKREMIYLYFKKYTQEGIGRHYGRFRTTAGYHIRRTLRQLQREMEGIAYEK